MIRKILTALAQVALCFSAGRSQLEAMMKIDFKIGEEKQNWMQLCFSNLGNWPLYIISTVMLFEPSRYSWSLQKVFAEHLSISFFLLDGHLQNMVIFAIVFFIAEWILRSQQFLLLILIYFLLKSDIHINLATTALIGIVFSNYCNFWWLHLDLESRSRKIWKTLCQLQILGCVVGGSLCLWLLNYFHQQGYFAATLAGSRYGIFILFITIIYFLQFCMTALWGHFSIKVSIEPSNFPINYSTANWIYRVPLSAHLKKRLRQQTGKYMELHTSNLRELAELKDLSPATIPRKISEILHSELRYLKLASSRLTSE